MARPPPSCARTTCIAPTTHSTATRTRRCSATATPHWVDDGHCARRRARHEPVSEGRCRARERPAYYPDRHLMTAAARPIDLATQDTAVFVAGQLAAGTSVLEVGCGAGDLAL